MHTYMHEYIHKYIHTSIKKTEAIELKPIKAAPLVATLEAAPWVAKPWVTTLEAAPWVAKPWVADAWSSHGIVSSADQCIGFLNLAKHRTQMQLTKASETSYYMKTYSEVESLRCRARWGSEHWEAAISSNSDRWKRSWKIRSFEKTLYIPKQNNTITLEGNSIVRLFLVNFGFQRLCLTVHWIA